MQVFRRAHAVGVQVWLLLIPALYGPLSSASAQVPRRMEPFAGVPIGQIGGGDDDVLLDPGPIACRGDKIALFDYGDMKLKSFDLKGKLRWALGRKGSGPGEYVNPTDLKVDTRGNIVLRDPPNGRILLFDPMGSLVRSVQVTSHNHQALPLAGGRYLLIGATSTAFAVMIDSMGSTMRSIPLTKQQIATSPISRQTVVGQAEDGGAVVGFLFGSGFMLVKPDGTMRSMPGIEALPFPRAVTLKIGPKKQYTATRIDPAAPKGSYSATMDDERAFFLFGGRSRHGGAIMDVYRRATGAYEVSYTLPEGTTSVTACERSLLLLSLDPLPTLTIYKTPVRR